MGIIASVKEWWNKMFKKQAEEQFGVKAVESPQMEKVISEYIGIYTGNPFWAGKKSGIKTINFAKTICSETARLAMLGTKIEISGSARAEWLNNFIDANYFQLRKWVEYGLAFGTVFLVPNDRSYSLYTPDNVLLVEYDNIGINKIIFKDYYYDEKKKVYQIRYEYHHFEKEEKDGRTYYPYYVTNKAFIAASKDGSGKPVKLKDTIWADLMEETPPILKANGERLDGPMFGVFNTPQANNIDLSSPLGLSIFAEAVEELRDLDVAYSRNALEIYQSKRTTLIDDRLAMQTGKKIKDLNDPEIELPDFANLVYGEGQNMFYQEINPTLNTDTRLTGINALLSQIGYKCGYSNGYFVFNERSGLATATQVESDDRRTLQFIKDVRDKIESCMDRAIYAASVYADIYDLAPAGAYEVNYDFGDIVYNREDDKIRWWQYVANGKIPFWYYLVKFEGFSEEDAKMIAAEAEQKQGDSLFAEE